MKEVMPLPTWPPADQILRPGILPILSLALLGAACPPKPPNPGPTPTPTPGFEHPELKLTARNGTIYDATGQVFEMKMFIPCWDPDEIDHGGWTSVNPPTQDYAHGMGANTTMVRYGLYRSQLTWPTSLDYQHGPCINDDCAQGWDPVYWQRSHDWGKYGADKYGMRHLVSIQDGWAGKHCVWGDYECASNTDYPAVGNTLTPFQKAWVNKIVETWCQDAYVFYEDGNEIGQTPAGEAGTFRLPAAPKTTKPRAPYTYKKQWSLDMVAYVREREHALGCVEGRPFGTNSQLDEVEAHPSIDFSITHDPAEAPEGRYGKWRLQNEHNPPGPPSWECAKYGEWKAAGQTWAYWRGGQTKADMDLSLKCMFKGEPIPSSCPSPQPNPADLKWNVKLEYASWYDSTPLVTHNCDYCAAIGMGEYEGQIRCECPARQEGDPMRPVCEQGLIQAAAPVWRGDGTIELASNGFLARCYNCSWLEVCNGPRTNCARAF
jgi:hypothetical protein